MLASQFAFPLLPSKQKAKFIYIYIPRFNIKQKQRKPTNIKLKYLT